MAVNTTMRPPSFAINDDAQEWMRSFERYSEFAEWNPRRKYRAFRNMMSGNAARWLESLNLEPNDDDVDPDVDLYEQLKEQFLEKFKISPTRQFQMRLELNNIHKAQTESLDTYLQRLEKLFYKLNIDDESSKMLNFIQGLPPHTKSHVMWMAPLNLEQAANAARAEELSSNIAGGAGGAGGPQSI